MMANNQNNVRSAPPIDRLLGAASANIAAMGSGKARVLIKENQRPESVQEYIAKVQQEGRAVAAAEAKRARKQAQARKRMGIADND